MSSPLRLLDRCRQHRWALALLIAVFGFGAIGMAAPALAEVRVGGDSNGYYRVGVKSWWEIPFRTVVRQRYDFSCGSAAVATLLTYHYERPTSENMSFVAMWKAGDQASIRKSGFSMLDMKNYLQGLGYRAGGFRLDLQQLAALNQPVIALLNLKGYKHFVVIKGVEGDEVLLGDPALGLRKMELKEFGSAWNGIVLGIVGEASGHKPVFNLASEWDPWARAPTRTVVDRRPVGDVTTFLPPIYQLTTQLQIDLRGGGL
jgi:predicted double-glycine peptidase